MLNIKFDKDFMSISPLDFIEKILFVDYFAESNVSFFRKIACFSAAWLASYLKNFHTSNYFYGVLFRIFV